MINRLKTKDFHFVLNSYIKKKLYSISKELNLSLSKTIIFIIEKSGVISRKMHLLSIQKIIKLKKQTGMLISIFIYERFYI